MAKNSASIIVETTYDYSYTLMSGTFAKVEDYFSRMLADNDAGRLQSIPGGYVVTLSAVVKGERICRRFRVLTEDEVSMVNFKYNMKLRALRYC